MDPLVGFKFLVVWDGRPVAGVSRIGALRRKTETIGYGNDPAPLIPGQTNYEPITLERGLIVDIAFELWANKAGLYENSGKFGAEVSLEDLRKSVTLLLCNQAGQVMKQYVAFNCWPSEYRATPDLDAAGSSVAFESMTLQNEGWQRDDSFVAPIPPDAYPSYQEPEDPSGS